MGTFGPKGEIDPSRGVIVGCIGKKRSGKSIMGMLFFKNYPGDKVVIDVAGDDGPIGPDVITISGNASEWAEEPPRWPTIRRDDDKPMTLRYVPDPGSKTMLEDMDLVVGMALAHGECMILVHEIGVLAPAGKTQKHTRRALMHNRHNGATTLVLCGPRSQDIDPLVLQQADLVYVFELQGVNDRKRIAESIGWSTQDFHTAVLGLGPHECLRYDANEAKPEEGQDDYRLVHLEKLPDNVVKQVQQYAAGVRPRRR